MTFIADIFYVDVGGDRGILGKNQYVSFARHVYVLQAYQRLKGRGKKKPIESVIMIIPGRGGGSAGGDHTS